MIFISPLILPDHYYLHLYLSDKAIESFDNFVENKNEFLEFDPIVGWRNQPNSGRGKWQIDEYGARNTHSIDLHSTDKTRVLFLGNSLTNGGMGISGNETISAYIEDSSIETMNFATMLYSLDQSYLAYKHYLSKYNAQIIVVGLSGDPTAGLTNRYVPFWTPSEENMPIIKPRFKFNSDSLTLIEVPPLQIYKNILNNSELLHQLSETDGYYKDFFAFKLFGLTPITYSGWYIFKRGLNFVNLTNKNYNNLNLLVSIMHQLRNCVKSHGAKIIFMILPSSQTTSENVWRKYLPDQYASMINFLKKENFIILDARKVLRESGKPLWKLYGEDESHYSAEGNYIIAMGLKKTINAIYDNR
ncbi:hypothetical protein ACFLSX_01370 [Calditrichota bacterium]